ncbi:MAG: ParB N-terminal domain-containing protein [Candidatus Bathyarchaeota archaeon]|nr:ParB N-terminal domain-containing protein [Candidatus Bathyarchaeota archaeon]
MTVFELFSSIKHDVAYWFSGKSEVNADVFFHPAKYAVCLPIDMVVADSKVSRQGIEAYKNRIVTNQKICPIIVVKHPRKELYAVLDGHHRYYAYRELGRQEIDCAIAGDYSSVIFYLTQHGYFQPSPEFTEGLRQPAIRLHQNLKQFLSNFIENIKQQD